MEVRCTSLLSKNAVVLTTQRTGIANLAINVPKTVSRRTASAKNVGKGLIITVHCKNASVMRSRDTILMELSPLAALSATTRPTSTLTSSSVSSVQTNKFSTSALTSANDARNLSLTSMAKTAMSVQTQSTGTQLKDNARIASVDLPTTRAKVAVYANLTLLIRSMGLSASLVTRIPTLMLRKRSVKTVLRT